MWIKRSIDEKYWNEIWEKYKEQLYENSTNKDKIKDNYKQCLKQPTQLNLINARLPEHEFQ